MSEVMTARQLQMARHALGLPNSKRTTYRNRYCLGRGDEGYADWEDLVSRNLAIKQTGTFWGGDDMFYLTLEGARAALHRGEHISREEMKELAASSSLRG